MNAIRDDEGCVRHAYLPAGWSVDEDLWLMRPARESDKSHLAWCDRAFQEDGRTYVAEIWETVLLDRATR